MVRDLEGIIERPRRIRSEPIWLQAMDRAFNKLRHAIASRQDGLVIRTSKLGENTEKSA
jgi:hypothetical protein